MVGLRGYGEVKFQDVSQIRAAKQQIREVKAWQCGDVVMLMSTTLARSIAMVTGGGGCIADCEVDGTGGGNGEMMTMMVTWR